MNQMNNKNYLLLFLFGIFFLNACQNVDYLEADSIFDSGAKFDVLQVLPLGNSITQGSYTNKSYRYYLWKKMIDAQWNFDFVGTLKDAYVDNPNWEDYLGIEFDRDHEGHWGWHTNRLADELSGWIAQYHYNAVLLHIGTNDMVGDDYPENTMDEIENIVEMLHEKNPDAIVFLATLIPSNISSATQKIILLNHLIKDFVYYFNEDQSRLVLVDQFENFSIKNDLIDNFHPNERGEEKIASKWFDALNENIELLID